MSTFDIIALCALSAVLLFAVIGTILHNIAIQRKEHAEYSRKEARLKAGYTEARQMLDAGATNDEVKPIWDRIADEQDRDRGIIKSIYTSDHGVIVYKHPPHISPSDIQTRMSEILAVRPEPEILRNYEDILGIKIVDIQKPKPKRRTGFIGWN